MKTDNGEVVLKGPTFNCTVLTELLALKADGIEPSSSQWFWYDGDSCSDDPHELYNFFVVSGDRIVREMSRSATTMTADLIQLFSSRLIIPIPFG